MDTISLEEQDRMARARAELLHGADFSAEALAHELKNVRAQLAHFGHPLEPESPKPRTAAPPAIVERGGRPVDWW